MCRLLSDLLFEKIARGKLLIMNDQRRPHQLHLRLDGDPTQNLEAFEAVVRVKEAGIGCGAINHPIDRGRSAAMPASSAGMSRARGRREGEGVPLSKLQKLGLYKNYNSTTIGYHGDPNEEADRQPNTLKIVRK